MRISWPSIGGAFGFSFFCFAEISANLLLPYIGRCSFFDCKRELSQLFRIGDELQDRPHTPLIAAAQLLQLAVETLLIINFRWWDAESFGVGYFIKVWPRSCVVFAKSFYFPGLVSEPSVFTALDAGVIGAEQLMARRGDNMQAQRFYEQPE